MERKRRPHLLRLQLLLGGVVCVVLLAGLALHAFAQTTEPLSGQVVIPDHSKWAPNFRLADQTGRLIGPQSFHGRVVVMTFLDAHCTQDCPVIGKELAYVQRKLGPSVPLTVLVVSVAPYTDSPAAAAAFAMKSGWTGDWHWLFGTPGQLAKVWSDYGIWVKPTPADILHTAALYVLGPDQYVRVADMVPFTPDPLAQSVRALAPSTHQGWLNWLPGF
ncbi:MAG TPA: SCO family protein [Chloroflexota bacterium]|nr:SCO family protein [Chloroflexota bacterium]